MTRHVVPVAAILLLIAACGGGSESTTVPAGDGGTTTTTEAPSNDGGDGPGIDPCGLLSTSDLESATGIEFGEGTYNESLSQDELWICDWVASGSGFATAQVLIVPSAAAFEGNRDSAADALGGVDDVEVPGADGAYRTTDGSILGMLVGDTFVQVAFIGAGSADPAEATLEMATTVVAGI